LPNNHLWDPAGIPDFHPQIHLNNDAGKLSRLMVATRKYKEIYDMQASRRKATWFNMQKLLVNNNALGILVLRSQHLLKVLEQLGLLESLVLKVLEQRFQHNVTYHEAIDQ
jgi:Fe-S cluster biosynthesis and repair protein YggX